MTSDTSSGHHLRPFVPEGDERTRVTQKVRLGLLAGDGEFPVRFATSAQAAGHSVFCLGVAGIASESLADVCDHYRVAPLARIGKAIRLFKHAGVERVVMAGRIERISLRHQFNWLRLLPDWHIVHVLLRYIGAGPKDHSQLRAVIREFTRENLHFDSALTYCPELLVKHGFLTRKRPSSRQWKDIQFGWELAREMGRLNIGQTVVVNDSAVLAVEAVEGTDQCIRRAGNLCRRGGFTVVKVTKPQQDMRFDVPTAGIETIKTMHESGGRVLAIEAGMTVLLQPEDVTQLADRFGISVVAVNTEELAMRAAA